MWGLSLSLLLTHTPRPQFLLPTLTFPLPLSREAGPQPGSWASISAARALSWRGGWGADSPGRPHPSHLQHRISHISLLTEGRGEAPDSSSPQPGGRRSGPSANSSCCHGNAPWRFGGSHLSSLGFGIPAPCGLQTLGGEGSRPSRSSLRASRNPLHMAGRSPSPLVLLTLPLHTTGLPPVYPHLLPEHPCL